MKSPLLTIAIASVAVGTLMWVSDSVAAFPTTQLGNQPIVPTAITQEVTPQAEYGNLILPDQTYSSSGVITLPIIPATGGEVSISTLFENPLGDSYAGRHNVWYNWYCNSFNGDPEEKEIRRT